MRQLQPRLSRKASRFLRPVMAALLVLTFVVPPHSSQPQGRPVNTAEAGSLEWSDVRPPLTDEADSTDSDGFRHLPEYGRALHAVTVAPNGDVFTVGTGAEVDANGDGACGAIAGAFSAALVASSAVGAAVDSTAPGGTTAASATGTTVTTMGCDAQAAVSPVLFRSTDGGMKWRAARVSGAGLGTTIRQIVVPPDYPSDSFVGVVFGDGQSFNAATMANGICWSTDGGLTFPAANCRTGANAATDPDLDDVLWTAMALSPDFNFMDSTGEIAIGGTAAGAATGPTTATASTFALKVPLTATTFNDIAEATATDAAADRTLHLAYTYDEEPIALARLYVNDGVGTYGQLRTGGIWTATASITAESILDDNTMPFSASSGMVAFDDDYTSGGSFFAAAGVAGTSVGGVFRFDGSAWSEKTLIRPVCDTSIDAFTVAGNGSSTRIVASTTPTAADPARVCRSTNEGSSWTDASADGGDWVCTQCRVHAARDGTTPVTAATQSQTRIANNRLQPENVYYSHSGARGGLMRSKSTGSSWSDTGLTNEAYVVAGMTEVSASAAFAIGTVPAGSTGAGLDALFLTNFYGTGAGWLRVLRYDGTDLALNLPDDFAMAGVVWARGASATFDPILRSTDGGQTFNSTATEPFQYSPASNEACVAGSVRSATTFYCGGDKGHVSVTNDGGATWTLLGVGSPVALAFAAQPWDAGEAIPFVTQPRVAIRDANGNVVTTATHSITLTLTPGTGTSGATLTCTSNSVAAVGGIATFSGCRIDQAGAGYTLTATAAGLAGATSAPFDVSPVSLAFTAQPAVATAGVSLETQPVVAIQDSSGKTISSATDAVSLSITAGTGAAGAVLTCLANPVLAVSGVAMFAGCQIDKAGSGYTLTATAAGITSATSASFDVNLYRLAFTVQPGGGPSGQAWAQQPRVGIVDASGSVVATRTDAVALSIASGTTGAVLICTPNSVAAVAGVATFSGCAINLDGSYVLRATATGLTAILSACFMVASFAPAPCPSAGSGGGSSGGGGGGGSTPTGGIKDFGQDIDEFDFTSDPSVFFITAEDVDNTNKVWLTRDGGITFTQVGNAPWGPGDGSISTLVTGYNPADHNGYVIVVTGAGTATTEVYRIKIGESTWTSLDLGIEWDSALDLNVSGGDGIMLTLWDNDGSTFGYPLQYTFCPFTCAVNDYDVFQGMGNERKNPLLVLPNPPVTSGFMSTAKSLPGYTLQTVAGGRVMELTLTAAFLAGVTLTSPANNGYVPTNVGDSGIPTVFRWSAMDGAIVYELLIGLTPILTDGTILPWTTTNLLVVPQFIYPFIQGTTYYWAVRVASTDHAGTFEGPWSPINSFTAVGTQSAYVTLNPTSGRAADTVQFSGTLFEAGETVEVNWDNPLALLATPSAAQGGNFSGSFTVPTGAPVGLHIVRARGTTSGKTAGAGFTVLSPTPPGAPTLRGVVTTGVPGLGAVTPPAGLVLDVTVFPASGTTALAGQTVSTDGNGLFSVRLPDLPGGSYDLKVKGQATLSSKKMGVALPQADGAAPLDFGTLRNGDLNGDDLILGADYSILVSNFGVAGPTTAPSAFMKGDAGSGGTVALALRREPGPIAPGQQFEVRVVADAGTQSVDAVDVFLSFPRGLIDLVEEDSAGGGGAIRTGEALPVVLLSAGDSSIGQVAFSSGRILTERPASGSFTVATLRFRALAPLSGTAMPVQLEFGGPRVSGAYFGGQRLVGR